MPAATELVLPALVLFAGLVIVTAFLAASFLVRRGRLPEAAVWEDISVRIQGAQTRLALKEEELKNLNKKIEDKDRLAAEAASLKKLIDTLKAEHATLDYARKEIEVVKGEAAEAAEKLAEEKAKLVKVLEQAEEAEKQIGKAQALEGEIAKRTGERDALDKELGPLRAEREAALRILEDVRMADARKAVMKEAVRDLRAEADACRKEAEGARRDLENVTAELRALEQKRGDVLTKLEAAEATIRRAEEVRREAEALEAALTAKRADLATLRRELDETRASLAGARATIAEADRLAAEIEARKVEIERLKVEIEQLGKQGRQPGAGSQTSPATPDRSVLLADLRVEPACLKAPAALRGAAISEDEALRGVGSALKDQGISYPDRTLRAFHTALKINDHAQMTVLAGVSGTGKSLLPRRYAEVMGLHFLQIAVEPRWDSPQDLLGFYNYVEQKYRATDLSRLLVRMNESTAREVLASDTSPRHDRVALVLLDEMNIARVEYYFSEFLSRLEARPRHGDSADLAKRGNAMIPVDIPGLDKPLALYPGHNILFCGTMNDDESTQALSDKVIDRANVLQFAAPKDFGRPTSGSAGQTQAEALPFERWRKWVRPASVMEGEATAERAIKSLAEIMEDFGRPFGHRLHDAILAYAANYPFDGPEDFRLPLADQIELRILPKLRGIQIDGHTTAFDKLETLVRETLDDKLLADRLHELRESQKQGTGLFNWRGLRRE